jgi:hypothetical protein
MVAEYEFGDDYQRHEWSYSGQIRWCWVCGDKETYWDDEEYPIDPCYGDPTGG